MCQAGFADPISKLDAVVESSAATRPLCPSSMEIQMIIATSRTKNLLEQFGLTISPAGEVVLADLESASSGHMHRTFEPVAALGWCAVSPSFARLRLPDYELGDVISNRPN